METLTLERAYYYDFCGYVNFISLGIILMGLITMVPQRRDTFNMLYRSDHWHYYIIDLCYSLYNSAFTLVPIARAAAMIFSSSRVSILRSRMRILPSTITVSTSSAPTV